MEVVLHCGIHRTGTTSIQQFLASNRGVLEAQRVGYPGERVNHQDIAWALKRGDIGASEVLELLRAQAGALDITVLSAEDFCNLKDIDWVEAVAKIFPTRAIFYLRRQDHWVMSWYNQHVKWPFDPTKARMSPSEFLESLEDFHWLDYSALLARWETALGRNNVSVGVIERGQVEDVVTDFVDRLGLDPLSLSFAADRTNDSLPVHMLEIARHLELPKLGPKRRMRLLAALKAGLADKTPQATTVYSPEERSRVLGRYADSNQEVARRYFGRDSLFLEPPPASDAPFYRFPDLSRDELMREWVAPVVQALVKGP